LPKNNESVIRKLQFMYQSLNNK